MKCRFRLRHVYAEAQLGTRLLEKDTNKTTLELPGGRKKIVLLNYKKL